MALALSGGGFRAVLFHLGVLTRLNECALLKRLERINSVSGGSIVAAWLGLRWSRLEFDPRGMASGLQSEVIDPLKRFCLQRVDVWPVLANMLATGLGRTSRALPAALCRLYGRALLGDLPQPGSGPRIELLATSLQTGSQVQLWREGLRDYRIGVLPMPRLPLCQAVAASCALPPLLSPQRIACDPAAWQRIEARGFSELYADERLRRTVYLADGGVYDNLGVDGLWDDCGTLFVSDASTHPRLAPRPNVRPLYQSLRALTLMYRQTQSLRKRILIGQKYLAGGEGALKGAYLGIATEIANYGLPDALAVDNSVTVALAGMRTRLSRFSPPEQGRLINWGYALCDAALRRHLPEACAGAPPGRLPEPGCPLE